MHKPVTISLPEDVLERIDKARGADVPRSRWILRALETALNPDEPQPVSVPAQTPRRSAPTPTPAKPYELPKIAPRAR